MEKYSRTWDNITSHRKTAANTNVAPLASYISSPRAETVTEEVKNVEKWEKEYNTLEPEKTPITNITSWIMKTAVFCLVRIRGCSLDPSIALLSVFEHSSVHFYKELEFFQTEWAAVSTAIAKGCTLERDRLTRCSELLTRKTLFASDVGQHQINGGILRQSSISRLSESGGWMWSDGGALSGLPLGGA